MSLRLLDEQCGSSTEWQEYHNFHNTCSVPNSIRDSKLLCHVNISNNSSSQHTTAVMTPGKAQLRTQSSTFTPDLRQMRSLPCQTPPCQTQPSKTNYFAFAIRLRLVTWRKTSGCRVHVASRAPLSGAEYFRRRWGVPAGHSGDTS